VLSATDRVLSATDRVLSATDRVLLANLAGGCDPVLRATMGVAAATPYLAFRHFSPQKPQ
jgi:hypothetical protein